ncbi:hypothetical protein N657DRAFT_22065 [Parathielavia appendiculata]|uniref:Uncharacterized protein n=1 Tax=Parathielavia appendiculata TaxID=2587402 RepID=A0AAN6Z7B7_9PEZI|nr:hypothetical protein N657DRAFT_22065 [Parathielavia appendiculata]
MVQTTGARPRRTCPSTKKNLRLSIEATRAVCCASTPLCSSSSTSPARPARFSMRSVLSFVNVGFLCLSLEFPSIRLEVSSQSLEFSSRILVLSPLRLEVFSCKLHFSVRLAFSSLRLESSSLRPEFSTPSVLLCPLACPSSRLILVTSALLFVSCA